MPGEGVTGGGVTGGEGRQPLITAMPPPSARSLLREGTAQANPGHPPLPVTAARAFPALKWFPDAAGHGVAQCAPRCHRACEGSSRRHVKSRSPAQPWRPLGLLSRGERLWTEWRPSRPRHQSTPLGGRVGGALWGRGAHGWGTAGSGGGCASHLQCCLPPSVSGVAPSSPTHVGTDTTSPRFHPEWGAEPPWLDAHSLTLLSSEKHREPLGRPSPMAASARPRRLGRARQSRLPRLRVRAG